MDFEEIEITAVQRIDIQDGDVLAVFVKGFAPGAAREQAKKQIQDAFLPKHIKVLMMSDAYVTDLKVIRAE